MAEFAVIGIGRFGRAVALNLAAQGQGVLAVDRDPARLARVAAEVAATAVADTTDPDAVAPLGLERVACTVVAIGERATEASLLTTAIVAQREVPRVVARAFNDRHARLLLAVGAHEVLNPEQEIGGRLALRLAHPGIRDRFGDGRATVAEVEAPEVWAGRTLGSLDLRRRGVTALALLRAGSAETDLPPERALASGDRLVLLGPAEALHEVAALL
jgi:trk system potassium uptake protein TrkA